MYKPMASSMLCGRLKDPIACSNFSPEKVPKSNSNFEISAILSAMCRPWLGEWVFVDPRWLLRKLLAFCGRPSRQAKKDSAHAWLHRICIYEETAWCATRSRVGFNWRGCKRNHKVSCLRCLSSVLPDGKEHQQPTKQPYATNQNQTKQNNTRPNQTKPTKKENKQARTHVQKCIYIYIYTHTLYKRKTTKNTLGCIKPVGCRLTAYSCLNLHHLHFNYVNGLRVGNLHQSLRSIHSNSKQLY